MNKARIASSLVWASFFTPMMVHAQIVTKAIGLFNAFVGLMLTAAILTYVIGVIIWSCRLGSWPSYRTEAIKIMEWAVVILFTLVVLLSIVRFIQSHVDTVGYAFSVVAILVVVGIGVVAWGGSQPSHEAKPEETE